MKRKRPFKLSLHRETVRRLESSDLRAIAGATAQIGCGNTLNATCKTCDTCGFCPIETIRTCPSLHGCTTDTL
jgi:hypothetical protein